MKYKRVSEREARAKGLPRYYTGKTCLKGHVSERRVCNQECIACSNLRSSKWRKANPAKRKAQQDRHRHRYPRRHQVKRRSLEFSAPGCRDMYDIWQLYKKQDGRCANVKCDAPLKRFHVDHKTPLSRGGSNWPRNLQLLCQPCNDRKGTRTQREWLRYLDKI